MTPAVRSIILSNRVGWSFMGDGWRVWDFTRASDGMRVNPAGSWETIGTNGLRYDYDPTTGSLRGVLIESARTNSLRNGGGSGASAGTPGTGPTNWVMSTTGAGITRTILGTGTEDGIDYVAVRYEGTPASGSALNIDPEGDAIVAASVGQVWAASGFVRKTAGDWPGTTALLALERGGSSTPSTGTSAAATSAALASQRFSAARTISVANTTNIQNRLRIEYTVGVAFSVDFLFGGAQLERVDSGVFTRTSLIRTTGSAATRAVDALSLPVPPGTYSVEVIGGSVLLAGTRYTDTVTVTGIAWDFAWPTAAITAGERHLQRVSMRRIG